ncbi:polysaccharide deacetylase family protein [Chryseobacterium sp. BIGb0232]|uniref:polysaccharide deacetylase family protein n=1 Tax=Chryseobacterium sp. BIGb0232 TaxID=2940598 RepID=UPI000F495238|nr:polysaccharide deacetylase family protein [Chryseobacterium sp. BIGb0232]MCS4305684.1 peptidoglycan/xylan/chitin deacetylase (PgdA/CDA1 family) [Chryseobacterium sp. BIGb0232]ROS06552.1 polysaccharide deacetylase [Chryseobacterium nakagawai]
MKDRLINLLTAFETDHIGKTFPLNYCLPLYHCVSDENLPHIKHVIEYKNSKDFEKDIDDLSKHFQWVNWQEFKDFTSGNFKAQKKIALLTFDDGFREFYDIVAPVLERKGIYACNFINPAFIDNKEIMFRCKASLLIDAIGNKTTINREVYTVLSLNSNAAIEIVKNKILKITYQEKNMLDLLAEKLEFDFKSYIKEYRPYLSTEELKHLTHKGFGISSHGWDHPKYGDLSLEEQTKSIDKTFAYLKENNFLYESFAFPFTDFGVKNDFFEELFKNEEMYCTFGTAGIKLDSVKRNFQRIPMETGESAEKILKREIAYFKVKKLINKNTIVRK